MIAKELRLREMERQKLVGQIDAFSALINVTKQELSLFRERIGYLEMNVTEKAEYIKVFEGPHAQGAVNALTFHQAKSELSNARNQWHDVRVAIAQTERKLLELEQEKTRIIVDADIQRYREIKEVSNALTEERLTQASIAAFLLSVASVPLSRDSHSDHVTMTLLRRGPSGFEQIGADVFSALQPGTYCK